MIDKTREAIIAYLIALDIAPDMEEWDVRDRVNIIRNESVAKPIGRIEVADGASKICLIFKDFPFVIKWNTYDYGEAMEEVSIYKDAVAKGLAFFFPKTEFFYEHNGVSFVIQEKIDYSVVDTRSKQEYVKAIRRITKTPTNKIYNKMQAEFNKAGTGMHRKLDENWAKMVISLYGKKATKSLCQFVVNHGINDLHASNIGYKNFRPIILDFSGYHR